MLGSSSDCPEERPSQHATGVPATLDIVVVTLLLVFILQAIPSMLPVFMLIYKGQ